MVRLDKLTLVVTFGLTMTLPRLEVGSWLVAAGDDAFGQDEGYDDTLEEPAPPRKKKRKAKGKRRREAGALPTEEAEAQRSDTSPLFPSWGTPEFDWSLDPVIGIRYTDQTTEDAGRVRQIAGEIGLAAGLDGIALAPGNPGLYVAPHIGHAWGNVTNVQKNEEGKDETTHTKYQRTWGAVSLMGYYKAYRHVLTVSRGRLAYDETPSTVVQTFGVTNDFGLMIVPHFSSHYTFDYTKAYDDDFDEPFIVTKDNWIHGRFFTEALSFSVDAGPGFAFVDEYLLSPHEAAGKGRTDYFKVLTGAQIFWKIVLAGQGRYVFHSSEERLGQYATVRLPDESLYEPPRTVMPEDSFVGSIFLGIPNIVAGLGIGWRYNIQILNWSEKDGRERLTTRDQGFGFQYTAAF